MYQKCTLWLAVALACAAAGPARGSTLYLLATSGTTSSIYTLGANGTAALAGTVPTLYSPDGDIDFLNGSLYASNLRAAGSTATLYLDKVDLAAGTLTTFATEGSTKYFDWTGLAADPASGNFYAWDAGNAKRIYVVDSNGNANILSGGTQADYVIADLAYDSTHSTLYAVGYTAYGNSLYTINTTTGVPSLIGNFSSTVSNSNVSLAYDNAASALYLLDGPTRKLYTLNASNGAATLNTTYSGITGTVVGLAVLQDAASPMNGTPEASTWLLLASGLTIVGLGRIGGRSHDSR